MEIKTNDNVIVITGKYKGAKGKVLKTSPKNHTVIVEGVNFVYKHRKARKANETARIIREEAPIDVSNVMLVCEKCGKPTRIAHQLAGKKYVRVCKKCGAVLDKAYAGKSKKAAPAAPAEEAPKKRTRKRSQKAEAPAQE